MLLLYMTIAIIITIYIYITKYYHHLQYIILHYCGQFETNAHIPRHIYIYIYICVCGVNDPNFEVLALGSPKMTFINRIAPENTDSMRWWFHEEVKWFHDDNGLSLMSLVYLKMGRLLHLDQGLLSIMLSANSTNTWSCSGLPIEFIGMMWDCGSYTIAIPYNLWLWFMVMVIIYGYGYYNLYIIITIGYNHRL